MSSQNYSNHYNNLGKVYNHLLFSDDDYQKYFYECLSKLLLAEPNHKVVDLGAGTCVVALAISKLNGLKHPVICIEPCESMFLEVKGNPSLELMNTDALTFSSLHIKYDRIFSRETIHHIPDNQLPILFQNLSNQLELGGLFVIDRLKRADNFPWFKKLKEKFSQKSTDFITSMLLNNGFNDVKSHDVIFPVRMIKSNLYHKLKSRYISTLSEFSDKEILEGIAELENSYSNVDEINFNYEREYIVAKVI